MNQTAKFLIIAGLVLVVGLLLLSVTGVLSVFPVRSNTSAATEPAQAGIANPASVHCEEQGYTVELRTDEQGGQYGVCIFSDGSECDEWAFFRGECGPGSGE
jgi:putative hemolysin